MNPVVGNWQRLAGFVSGRKQPYPRLTTSSSDQSWDTSGARRTRTCRWLSMMEKPPVGTLPHCGVQRHEVDERFQLLDLRLERGKRPVKRGTKVLRLSSHDIGRFTAGDRCPAVTRVVVALLSTGWISAACRRRSQGAFFTGCEPGRGLVVKHAHLELQLIPSDGFRR